MAIRKVVIFTEDTYGVDFFIKLVNRLRREKLIENVKFEKPQRIPGKCSVKFGRKLVSFAEDVDKIIVVIDSEGNPAEEVVEKDVMRCLMAHIKSRVKEPNKMQKLLSKKLEIVVVEPKIEMWICVGLNIKVVGDPVRSLTTYLRTVKNAKSKYEKYMLSDFVDCLDIEKLVTKMPSFKKFLDAIRREQNLE